MKNTKQKLFVLNNLKSRFDHPTIKQILFDAQQQNFNIGETSIYRILNNLVESGEVVKIVTKDNIAHYDINTNSHIHLVCNNCNQIVDVPTNKVIDLKNINNFTPVTQDIAIFGKCNNCQ